MFNSDQILLQAHQVQDFVKQNRDLGKKIVLTQGTFDLVHIGHARYCDKAKSYGDILIVGLDSDEKVRQRKGPDRPVVPQDERLEMLTHLKSVDLVVLKELNVPKYNLIKLVKPDVLVATNQTYTQAEIKNLGKWCGHVEVLKPMATTSTSAKLRRMQIGMAKRMSEELGDKLMKTIEDFFNELKKK